MTREGAGADGRLRVFVYGTLKRGGRFHDALCRGALSIEEAQVRGRVEAGGAYPVLTVPEADVLATGTADPLADVAIQERVAAFAPGSDLWPPEAPGTAAAQSTGHGEWDLVAGEIMTFDDPAERLPALDRLEDFNPGGTSLYRRVLLPVRIVASGEVEVGWAWVGP